jgi:CxxC motif-containing protein (DUF1111 family)
MRTLLSVRVFVSMSVTLFAITVIVPRTGSAINFATEAITGFDLASNGFAEQFCASRGQYTQSRITNSPNSPRIPDDECSFDTAAEEFTGPEGIVDGLGPIFNGVGCGECHVTPILGGFGQISEKRAGFFNGREFIEHPGGSLIQDRSTVQGMQEMTMAAHTNVTAFRGTLSVLGDGFVEAISNETLERIRDNQRFSVRGRLIQVPVLEAPGAMRIGRFGWKNQQASLVSFSADAYVNEMGITSPLQAVENTSNGASVAHVDQVPGEASGITDDEGVDVELFALFMRSTKAPPRDLVRAATRDARDGSELFDRIGCGECHTRTITTAPAGTVINGGAFTVPSTLGDKIIHPFSDYLLHDIGTGDGIVQNGGAATRNMIRTVPLWGLRTRGRFLHDGFSFSVTDAILRHANQGRDARNNFRTLSPSNQNKLLAFLMSL